MCGIAGILGKVASPRDLLNNMSDAVVHRGPDDQGIWFDGTVGLAHTRLSIIDLSSAGHQPMHSKSERYVMVFNGEIYNYKSLCKELESISNRNWLGHSDTEVLLAAIEQWGLSKTLKKTSGMFAIALWDKCDRKLYLARDRFGEKPIYYGWVNGLFVFASEIKALRKVPGFCNQIDRNALGLFLRFNSIPAPHSIYQNIFKLEPGCITTFFAETKKIVKKSYWSMEKIYNKASDAKFCGTPEEAVNKLESILLNSISSQTHADVPLGAFLSGGIDSSSITALMQSQYRKKINTFSIGFENQEYNESGYAQMVAKHLGTDHCDMQVTEQDALNVIPMLPHIYDEPFADSSQIPTFLVSKIAKQKVAVSLSGDGGDELFGGYNRYLFVNQMFNTIKKIPTPVKNLIKISISSLSEKNWDRLFGRLLRNRVKNIGSKLHKGIDAFSSNSIRELHFKLASQIQDSSEWLIKSNEYKTPLNDNIVRFSTLNSIEQMMAYDLLCYLPTDILTKVDRAAMAVSLETRMPFLDPKVFEFSASLPLDLKIRNGVSKWVLREVLYKHVPKNLIERPKMGFGVPIVDWLRGSLRDWAESLLDEKSLKEDGFFNVKHVRSKWVEHLNFKQNWHHQLWNVLIFQAWLKEN